VIRIVPNLIAFFFSKIGGRESIIFFIMALSAIKKNNNMKNISFNKHEKKHKKQKCDTNPLNKLSAIQIHKLISTTQHVSLM
jgi:hypothetical protein